ncbi:NUDIX hydrolase [Tianweitania populi]|uniref:NUDIX hydrolase n=1 Tax=Tianweitania populi TaxID=1607949 RepID=A0A8J3DUM4_9HYPH|nr:NUDIX hydrolase [Tianweitania populi]GHD08704.1 NUDIX hydrolase [Tianweitania populi]
MMHLQRLVGFRSHRLQVAALPWRRSGDGIEVMLITSRGSGRWILPKGWPEGGEALFDAAAREAGEEAGIAGTISPQTLGSYNYEKRSDAVSYEVQVYPLEVQSVAKTWRERGQRQRRWMSLSEAADKVREPELAAMIRTFSPTGERKAA